MARRTCWLLLRPHQDQSRVAPPAKSWKPRSLSTGPTLQRSDTNKIAAARDAALDAIFAKPDFHSDAHRLTSMAVDIFVSTVSCISSIAFLTLLALVSSALNLLHLPRRAAASDCAWVRGREAPGRTQDMFGCCSNCPRRSRSCRRRPAVLLTPTIASLTSCSCFCFCCLGKPQASHPDLH